MIRVAILHYHLRRGGVTSVLKSVAKALGGRKVELLVLSGEASPEENFPLSVEVVPELNYRDSGGPDEVFALTEALLAGARKGFGGVLPDVWHIHNHSLGKNVLLPAALTELSRVHEAKLLLQFHDFAEDSRPDNYRRQLTFEEVCPATDGGHLPPLPQTIYTALNNRDLGFIRSSGIPDSRLRALPNPVSVPTAPLPSPFDRPLHPERKFLLYPTRAIRRKNLGELILLAVMHRDTHHFATTLIPDNAQWIQFHKHWEKLIVKYRLPVTLGLGMHHDFHDLLGWADGLITTSVAEGFGLAFLEPWLIDKPLVGRDLPEITDDFGIDLKSLYSVLEIPSRWIDRETLKRSIEAALNHAYTSYGREVPPSAVDAALESFYPTPETIDFGKLDESLQTYAIECAIEEGFQIPEILDLPEEPVIRSNHERAVSDYSLEAYGEHLQGLYQELISTDLEPVAVDPSALLDQFLAPERLNLLRTN